MLEDKIKVIISEQIIDDALNFRLQTQLLYSILLESDKALLAVPDYVKHESFTRNIWNKKRVDEFIGNPKFIIKPNPVGNSFILSPSDYVEEIRIFNIHGQLVDIHKLQNQYSVSHLDDGFYFVFIEMGNGNIIIEKIIKQLK